MCLPYFSGVLSPYWDDEARGMFYGLRGTHGMPQMYRAMLEGITYEIQLCLADLESARGRALDELVVVGGGAGSALWLQIIADVTGRPVTVCAQSEVTALGAAMHAMAAYEASNGVPVEDVVAAMTSRGHQYLPDEHRHREYQRWFEVYREIYHTNKPLLARIASVEKTNVAGT
jgi:xylulokinase